MSLFQGLGNSGLAVGAVKKNFARRIWRSDGREDLFPNRSLRRVGSPTPSTNPPKLELSTSVCQSPGACHYGLGTERCLGDVFQAIPP